MNGTTETAHHVDAAVDLTLYASRWPAIQTARLHFLPQAGR